MNIWRTFPVAEIASPCPSIVEMKMIKARLALVTLGVLMLAGVAGAQQTAPVVPISQTDLNLNSPWLSGFRTDVAKGDSDNLAKAGTEFLDELNVIYGRGRQAVQEGEIGPEADFFNALQAKGVVCCDYQKHYYLLMFAALDPQGKAILANVLVHAPDPPSPTLPGLKGPDEKLFEIFVAEDSLIKINGYYDVKKTENPALQQTSTFATTVLGKLGLPSTLSKFTVTTAQLSVKSQIDAANFPPPPPRHRRNRARPRRRRVQLSVILSPLTP
jgi:hypothetical protein